MFEYYTLTFAEVIQSERAKILNALITQPRLERQSFFETRLEKIPVEPDKCWNIFRQYLDDVEGRMSSIIGKHSTFYWLHLLRRIGVNLSEGHDGKTDAPTIHLVRTIAEMAYLKHSDLGKVGDIAPASTMSRSEILGGLFESTGQKHFGKDYERYAAQVGSQWVLADYSASDHVDISRVEGLAYEYWWATAKLRAIGKGASTYIADRGEIRETRDESLAHLIDSYDRRIEHGVSLSTNVGIASFPMGSSIPELGLCCFYNSERVPANRWLPKELQKYQDSFVSNFQIGKFDYGRFVENHSFLSTSFRDHHGFGFEETVLALQAVCNGSLGHSIISHEAKSPTPFHHVLQRAYHVVNESIDNLKRHTLEMARELQKRGLRYGTKIESELDAVFAYLTLDRQKQSQIALWSHGPRPLLIPHGSYVIVDLCASPFILTNLFFRVRHNQTERGIAFEDSFRAALLHQQFKLLPNRELRRQDGEKRETDAGVRCGDTLFLLDCRSAERPLDFEIGQPKTIRARNEIVFRKCNEVASIQKFVEDDRVGANYDFSWARRIIGLGVSPFVEWIPSRDALYWWKLEEDLPRLVSVDECLAILQTASRTTKSKPGGWRPASHRRKRRRARR